MDGPLFLKALFSKEMLWNRVIDNVIGSLQLVMRTWDKVGQ